MCFRRFYALCGAFALFCSISVTCYAVEPDFSEAFSDDEPVVDDGVTGLYSVSSSDIAQDVVDKLLEVVAAQEPVQDEEPMVDAPAVVVVQDSEPSFRSPLRALSSVDVDIGNEEPAVMLFNGACWVTGIDSSLGRITIYFPREAREAFGVDSNGYLVNVSTSTRSGYLSSVYNNAVSASALSYPQYRTGTGSGYLQLHLIPENSNMLIATASAGRYDFSQVMWFMLIAMLGVLMVICMRR